MHSKWDASEGHPIGYLDDQRSYQMGYLDVHHVGPWVVHTHTMGSGWRSSGPLIHTQLDGHARWMGIWTWMDKKYL